MVLLCHTHVVTRACLQLENVNNGTRNGMWDSLVFNKIKDRLGGRVRMMATGAAPMPAHIMDFLKVN